MWGKIVRRKAHSLFALTFLIVSSIILVGLKMHIGAVEPSPLYWKKDFVDYAPSGLPDFDQRQNGTYLWKGDMQRQNIWSHCAPVSVANSLWWYDSKYESLPQPQPVIRDTFSLVSSYNSTMWDDHDPRNVQPLVEHLAYLMDTDGRRTGGLPPPLPVGTQDRDIQAGIAQYLSWTGVNPIGDVNGDGTVNQTDVQIMTDALYTSIGDVKWNMAADIYPVTVGWPNRTKADNVVDIKDVELVTRNINRTGTFYEKAVPAPNFSFLQKEIERSEDVILVLGFWNYNGTTGDWKREENVTDTYDGLFYPTLGHCVTVAGVNPINMQVAISDPALDNAEPPPRGTSGVGRVFPTSPHPHPKGPPDNVHNDAQFICHDIYNVTTIPSCPGGQLSLVNYPNPISKYTVIEWAIIVSPLPSHDAAVINLTPVETIVTENSLVHIDVTVQNQGTFKETFDVDLRYAYYDSNNDTNVTGFIGSQNVTLNSTSETTLEFDWNTSTMTLVYYLLPLNCTIRTEIPRISGESDIEDNKLETFIIISIFGDLNGDGIINIQDIFIVAKAYQSKPGDEHWDPRADLDGNNLINIVDLYEVAKDYGKTV